MIQVVCIRGSGDKEAPGISDPLITTIPIAVRRGKHFIDDNWWKVRSRTFRSPFVPGIDVNSIVHIVDANLGLDHLHKVTRVTIKISRAGIDCSIGVERYEQLEEVF